MTMIRWWWWWVGGYIKYTIPCTQTAENPPFHDMIYFEINVYYQYHLSARYTNN